MENHTLRLRCIIILKELKGFDIHVIGLDLKEMVIRRCSGLAKKYGYEKLHFLVGDIADYEGVNEVCRRDASCM